MRTVKYHKWYSLLPTYFIYWRMNISNMECHIENVQDGYKLSEDFVTLGHQTWQCVISSCGVSSRTIFTSHHFQRHYQNGESASTPQSGRSHETCLGGFGGNGNIVWTSAVSHVGRTSNAFKVTMKLQTFLFQMVVNIMYFSSVFVKIKVLQNPPIIYTHPVVSLIKMISTNKSIPKI